MRRGDSKVRTISIDATSEETYSDPSGVGGASIWQES